jgi:hypothetical protein
MNETLQALKSGQEEMTQKIAEPLNQLVELMGEMDGMESGEADESGDGSGESGGQTQNQNTGGQTDESDGSDDKNMASHLDDKERFELRKQIENKAESLGVELSDRFDEKPAMKKVISAAKGGQKVHLDSAEALLEVFQLVDANENQNGGHLDSGSARDMGRSLQTPSGGSSNEPELDKNPAMTARNKLDS